MTAAAQLELTITAKEQAADGVVTVTLAHHGGRRLPDWAPGAHIDLILPNGLTRQYSLCGNRWDTDRYRIGVLREPRSRGGSAYVHDSLAVGDVVSVGGPRNNFALAPAARYLFIAGGIGITPLLPMIAQADMLGCAWQLIYGGRSRRTMAFRQELEAYGDKVSIRPDDEYGRPDISDWLDDLAPEALVYSCGPAAMLEALQRCCSDWPPGRLRVERFVAKEYGAPVRTTAFEVELRRSRRRVLVQPKQSVLDAVQQAGVAVLSSCGQGVCGTCETAVLGGEPDHRDSILDDAERDAGQCMFICVSRARSDRLVLDL